MTIIGARPQFIKAAVVSRAIKKHASIEEMIIHTGQHFDSNMSDVFFRQLGIPSPVYNLDINSISHGAMTGRMLEKIEEVAIKENPDWVLVYGDTNSTLAGALAASKLNIKIAHVEAGLRSYNRSMPEEVNRVLTDRLSSILFCPSDQSISNLKLEGYGTRGELIVNCGDVMKDASNYYYSKDIKPNIILPKDYIVCTLHRDDIVNNKFNLEAIFKTLEKISASTTVILPIHPRTKSKLLELDYDFKNTKIIFLPPMSYFEMIYLIKNCQYVMTDSGGLQKEAYFFNKYCITLRKETEWTELVQSGYNFLVDINSSNIYRSIEIIKRSGSVIFDNKYYGDGNAGDKIVSNILNY